VRELLTQPGDFLALAPALVQRGAQPSAQRRVAGALANRHARRRGRVVVDVQNAENITGAPDVKTAPSWTS
jgi:hypothetical protein